jgi:uncharacterized protein (TIGR03435 family)
MLVRTLVSTLVIAGLGLLLAGCETPGPTPTPTPYQPPATAPAGARGDVALTVARNPTAESTVALAESTHTLTGTNLRLADLISVAYRTPERAKQSIPLLSALRVVSDRPLPADRYDVRIFIPGGKAQQLLGALAGEVERTFGVTVRREMRQTAALVLVAPGGKLDVHRIADAPTEPGFSRLTLTGDDLVLLAEQLEESTQQPVVNDTGLRGPYELRLRWPQRDGRPQPLPVDAARTALREQLGLDFTPALRSIEFLVVEQAPARK